MGERVLVESPAVLPVVDGDTVAYRAGDKFRSLHGGLLPETPTTGAPVALSEVDFTARKRLKSRVRHEGGRTIVLKAPHLAVETSDTGLGSLAGSRKRMAEVGEMAVLVAIELVRPTRVELVATRVASVVPECRHQNHRFLAASYSATRFLAAS